MFSSLTFPLRMSLTILLALAMLPLAFGGLPPAYQPQALGLLTVTLVPTLRLKEAVTPLAQTWSRLQTATMTGTFRGGRVMLRLSHGRWCSLGPPGRLFENLSGTLLLQLAPWMEMGTKLTQGPNR